MECEPGMTKHIETLIDSFYNRNSMITKEQLTAGMTHECDVCSHLFTKLSPESYSYRPTPQQRSTIELMKYLAVCGIAGIRSLVEGNYSAFAEGRERLKDMAPEDFPAEMEKQKAEIMAYMANLDDETLRTLEVKTPAGQVLPLGAAIIYGPFKWLSSYKMQLFLYAKATGASEIGTANAWAGMDWKG